LTRFLACCLLASLAAGCRAQNAATTPPISATPQLNRRIEVLIRSQFDVPPNMDLALGALSKSDFPGYQTLPITFSDKGKSKTIDFLLSNDGNTVARLETFDISHSPGEMISTAGRPVRGNSSAKVTIVNFDDLECPYCAQMHAELFPETAQRYKNLVKFIYKDYPLVEIHPWAMHAAVNANCLADQNGGAYWNFVDYVHAHGDQITGPSRDVKQAGQTLDKLTRDEGERSKLDLAKLDRCVAKQDESAVRASMKQGDALGVNGTPTIFINGERISGAEPASLIWVAIDRALKAAGVQPPPPAETGAASPADGSAKMAASPPSGVPQTR
jgi:protein-disulfide isomerase